MNTLVNLCILTLLHNAYSQYLQIKNINSYQSCWKDADCKPNALCWGKSEDRPAVCVCETGYDIYRNATFYACFKAPAAGEPCIYDYNCKIKLNELAVCDKTTRTCTCDHDIAHLGPDKRCYETKKLDERCLVDYDCPSSNGYPGFCDFNHICSCPLKMRPSEDKLRCLLNRTIGEKCSTDSECDYTPNAVCREVCECRVGYTISRHGPICLKAATKFGHVCDEDDQCSKYLEHSVCVNKTCSCQRGYHSYVTKCIKSIEVGSACNKHYECVVRDKDIQSVQCIAGVCMFVPDQHGSASESFMNRNIVCILILILYLCK